MDNLAKIMMLMSLLNVKLSGRVIQTHEHFRDVRARAFFFFYTEVHEHNMLKLGGILRFRIRKMSIQQKLLLLLLIQQDLGEMGEISFLEEIKYESYY